MQGCDGFAGVYTEHKSQIVQVLKNRGWLTGMIGDGACTRCGGRNKYSAKCCCDRSHKPRAFSHRPAATFDADFSEEFRTQ